MFSIIKRTGIEGFGIWGMLLFFSAFGIVPLSEAKTKENNAQLKIATCQFPVSNDIGANAHYIKKYILEN